MISSCTSTQNKDEKILDGTPAILPEMRVGTSPDGWGGDIILHIQKTEKLSSEMTRYKILSDYKGTPVGFDLIIKQPAKRSGFVPNGITFRSIGDTSNNFLKTLAGVYDLKWNNLVFTDSLAVTYTDLTVGVDLNKPGNWIAAQMKLFFETEEDTYELYLDISEKDNTVSFSEKDVEYRNCIVEALSKKK